MQAAQHTLCSASDISFVLSILCPCIISISHPSILHLCSTHLSIHPFHISESYMHMSTHVSIYLHPPTHLISTPAFSRHPPIQPPSIQTTIYRASWITSACKYIKSRIHLSCAYPHIYSPSLHYPGLLASTDPSSPYLTPSTRASTVPKAGARTGN